MKSSQLMETWGLETLRENGYTVSDKAKVTVTLEMELDGCCEECWSEIPVLVITSGRITFPVYEVS